MGGAQTFKNNNNSENKQNCGYDFVAVEVLSPLLYEPDIYLKLYTSLCALSFDIKDTV